MDTIQVEGWQGRLGQGLAPRQLLATMLSMLDLKVNEIAERMNCAPSTAEKTLDRARFKMGAKTNRGLIAEAMRRGIIAPLVLALLVGGGQSTPMQPMRRPEAPRTQTLTRVQRLDEAQLAA
ncbi:helix-turn-helix transcriptional regulator [Pseudomonas songnenensis]|uniref:Helix-turn-helix transcriptional regulator n=1 Tax=Pseudomonas songnenensis TaxID=1176259 RepID=A0ABX9UQK0_9PSED|nr:helix-turn-helix transcriptional regulator [Pseudomonas songnenensis]MCQ4302240.1 helix-turn-helix transcriptional regulator [Pseudomonas songnenensis]RMH95411.1 helix-turn-helix transcriptional regulator [Pseudomonas songnenensis]